MADRKPWSRQEILGLVGFLAVVAGVVFYSLHKGGTTARMNACISNLRWIDAAKEQTALALTWTNGTPVMTGDTNVNMYMNGLAGTTNTPGCLSGGRYTYNPVGVDPTCTIEGHALPAP